MVLRPSMSGMPLAGSMIVAMQRVQTKTYVIGCSYLNLNNWVENNWCQGACSELILWFRKDGFVGGTLMLDEIVWANTASCTGGDGRAAEFLCVIGQQYACPLPNYLGGSHAGMPCHCNGWPGLIVEE